MGWSSYYDHELLRQAGNNFKEFNEHVFSIPQPPPLEMIPLIISGPSSNRVDLVFFSDGCTPKDCSPMIL